VNTPRKSIDYDIVKDIYDEVRVGDPEMVLRILSGVSLTSDSLVLDVGCGTGNNTLLFQRAVKTRTIGIDFSYGMLLKAKEKQSPIVFTQAPAENLPFRRNIIDFIFMTEVIHHIENVNSSISEMNRVLKPDCWMCIVTQSHEQIEHRMTSRFFPATVSIDQARYPSIDYLEKTMNRIGFSEVQSKCYEFEPVELGTDYLQTVEMRGFSMLHKINDEDYNKGLSTLQSAFSQGELLLYNAQYTFVWARK
jgi:ubiquinone/menaquinone biosynthesis C-methylase UbiE